MNNIQFFGGSGASSGISRRGRERNANNEISIENSKGEKVKLNQLIADVRAGGNIDARIKALTDANISKSQAEQIYRQLGGDMDKFYKKSKDAWYAKREVVYLIMAQAQK